MAPGATLSAPSAWRITGRAEGGYVIGSADSPANVPAGQIELTARETFIAVDIETTVERTNNIAVGLQVAGTIAIS